MSDGSGQKLYAVFELFFCPKNLYRLIQCLFVLSPTPSCLLLAYTIQLSKMLQVIYVSNLLSFLCMCVSSTQLFYDYSFCAGIHKKLILTKCSYQHQILCLLRYQLMTHTIERKVQHNFLTSFQFADLWLQLLVTSLIGHLLFATIEKQPHQRGICCQLTTIICKVRYFPMTIKPCMLGKLCGRQK